MTRLASSAADDIKIADFITGIKTVGRPRVASSERSRRPWLAEGISQRTFYRRKAATLRAPELPHDAHVAAWKALSWPERVDIKIAARRLKNAAARRRPFGEEIEIALRKRAH